MSEELLGSLISGTVVAVGATGFYFLFKWVFRRRG